MKNTHLSDELGFDVSRETYERLTVYHDLLLVWSRTHNLIGPRERDHIWDRHILDCLQLWPYVREGKTVLDIGSGAGLPGIVLACCGSDLYDPEFVLVESNAKRCAFLRHVSRELRLNVSVENMRVEDVSRETIDYITARAVIDLDGLLNYSQKWVDKGARAVFLKGKTWKDELTQARQYWSLKTETTPSLTDPAGVILTVSEATRETT